MAIQDSIPERRNLIVISLAIIVYFLAGGKIDGEEARLVLVNVKFSNPLILEIFVWVIFVWFVFRYWVVSKGWTTGTIKVGMKTEFESFAVRKLYNPYFQKILNEKYNQQNANYRFTALFYHSTGYKFLIKTNGPDRQFEAKTPYAYWIIIETVVRAFFQRPLVNAYYTPYILTWLASLLMVGNVVFRIIN